jgi:hypothetical protein
VLRVPASSAKALHRFLDRSRFPEAKLVETRTNAISRVDVVEKSATVSWLQNPNIPLPQAEQVLFIIDGDAATPVVKLGDQPSKLDFLDFTLSSAASQTWRPERVLIVGAGGGVDVAIAHRNGAKQIDAVEVNEDITDLVTKRYAEFSGGLFQRPGISLHMDEGRHFVRHQKETYDLIQLSLVDTWAGSAAGAYSLAESYLYTVEAFSDYIERLNPNGVLTVTRWLWNPPRETLKLFIVATEALRSHGIKNPEKHLAVLGLGPFGNLLVKRKPFDTDELLELARVAQRRGFGVVYAPLGTHGTVFHDFSAAKDKGDFYSSYLYDVRPATDDSPFFFQFGRWRDANPLGSGWRDNNLVLSGRLVLLAVLLQALLFSAVLLSLPLWVGRSRKTKRDTPHVLPSMSYFVLIGLAFMFIEMSLIQKFTLFIGHPVYSVAFVLATLLISAGMGSASAPRIKFLQSNSWALFVTIVALLVLYSLALPVFFEWTLGYSLPLRMALGVALLMPLGFFMGIPFPLALSRLSKVSDKRLIGLSWAANGCGSVVGPILATIIAMDFGLKTVLLAAGCFYAAALLVFRLRFAQK